MSASDRIEVVRLLTGIGWIVTRNGWTVTRFKRGRKREAEKYARVMRSHCRCGHEDYCGSGCGGHQE